MKPEQFIREFGEKKAREVVEGAPQNAQRYFLGKYLKQGECTWWWSSYVGKWLQFEKHVYGDSKFDIAVDLSDLKRLVESLDIINELGSLRSAKANVREMYADSSCDYVHPEAALYDYKHLEIGQVMKAIHDHESIYGAEQ